MSDEPSFYFGAYLEIQVKEAPLKLDFRMCADEHKDQDQYDFCSKCGLPIEQTTKTILHYPVLLDDFLEDKWEDELAICSLLQEGRILAVGNNGERDRGEWRSAPNEERIVIEAQPFPTLDEILAMENELLANYAPIIEALKQSESVVRVDIKTGIIIDYLGD